MRSRGEERERGGRAVNANVTTPSTLSVSAANKRRGRGEGRETRRGANGAPSPRLLASARPPAPAPLLSGRGVGGAEVWDQLRADCQQFAGPDAGGGAPPVAEREQGEALRRGPQGADVLRQHRRRVHNRHRQREPAGNSQQPRRRSPVGGAARAALHTGHPHHLHHRRQRGVLQQRHRHDGQSPTGHEGDLLGCRRPRPRQPGDRLLGALGERARRQLPAVVRRIPGGPRAVHQADARLPRSDQLAVPDQRVPVLCLQGEPRQRVAAVRAVRAQPRRARPQHQPQLRQHAVRADRRRVRGHEAYGPHGRRHQDLRDRVAVQGGRGRDRRHRGERRGVQRKPHSADCHEPGDTAQAQRANRRVRVRALQRGHEARADIRTELRSVLPQRLACLRHQHRRRQRVGTDGAVRSVLGADHVLVGVQIGDDVLDWGGCPTRRIIPLSFLHTYQAERKSHKLTKGMIGVSLPTNASSLSCHFIRAGRLHVSS